MTSSARKRMRAHTPGWLGAALWLALFPGAVWAADAPPAAPKAVDDPFAALHARLEVKADEVLLRAAHPADSEPGSAPKVGTGSPAVDSATLQDFAQRYWSGQERDLLRAVERVRELRPVVEPILKEEGLPTEVLGLMLVESGGRPRALSPKGARGLWQFMPATARRYDLRVDFATDDRVDVERSTRAAARHLRDLHEVFGEWPLALAAYNAGDRAVQRAVRRAGSRNFATLISRGLLPAETRTYVPAVLAAASLFGDAGIQGLGPRSERRSARFYAGPRAELTGK